MGALDDGRLRGLWERTFIRYYDGREDSSSVIYWMQSATIYADIRVPRDFHGFRPGIAPTTLTLEELEQLVRCGGFGGRIDVEGSTCTWERQIDWQPDTGVPDVAELQVEESHLIEEGGACGGHQIWQRRTSPYCGSLGLILEDEDTGATGVLVAVEGQFIYVRGRVEALPPASNIGVHLSKTPDLDAGRSLFDAEVSYGVIEPTGGLRVLMSTLPWRVDETIAMVPGNVTVPRALEVVEHFRTVGPDTRHWRVMLAEAEGEAHEWRTPGAWDHARRQAVAPPGSL